MSDEEKLTDYLGTEEVILDLRNIAFPCLENCFMYVMNSAREHKCTQLLNLCTWILMRVRSDYDEIELDEYINDDVLKIKYKDLIKSAEKYINNQDLQERIDKAINILENDIDYDDSDFESRRFQRDIIRVLKGETNGREIN